MTTEGNRPQPDSKLKEQLCAIAALAAVTLSGCSPATGTDQLTPVAGEEQSGDTTETAQPGPAPTSTPETQPHTPQTEIGSGEDQDSSEPEPQEPQAPAVEKLKVRIVETYPRYQPEESWTQGFEFDGPELIEGTGHIGTFEDVSTYSELRRINPTTGELIKSVPTVDQHYGEGITLVGDEIYQITWQEQTAHVYDAETLEHLRSYDYPGQGWGLCYDGHSLWMTDGSAKIFQRDPKNFAILSSTTVKLDGVEINMLNELECVDGTIYANVWQTTDILRIDPKTGNVTAVIDASGLGEHETPHKTLNGIAYDRATSTFLLTGKLWDNFYRCEFVPA